MEYMEDLNLAKVTTTTTITVDHLEIETCPKYNAMVAKNMGIIKKIVPRILGTRKTIRGKKEVEHMLPKKRNPRRN